MDRLTTSPDDIIDVILSLLPFREAVKLCLVNHELKTAWRRRAEIILSSEFWKDKDGNARPTLHFIEILGRILQNHTVAIIKFDLETELVNQVIVGLEGRGVKTLYISSSNSDPYLVPEQVYRSDILEVIDFRNCILLLPSPDFIGFNNITELFLEKVIIPSVVEVSMRKLRWVYFLSCEGIHNLRWADSRSIVSFSTILSSQVQFAPLSGLPLQYLGICGRAMERESGIDLEWLNNKMSGLTTLRIDGLCLEFLALSYRPTKLIPGFLHLADITFFNLSIRNMDHMDSSLCILRSTPNLTSLVIMNSIFDGPLEDYQEPVSENLSFPHLQQLRVRAQNGFIPELYWVKIVVANSPMLESVMVEVPKMEEYFEVMNDVLKFTKANQDVSIKFIEF